MVCYALFFLIYPYGVNAFTYNSLRSPIWQRKSAGYDFAAGSEGLAEPDL